jgi:RNA polymerase sigma factor (sigma-70 family)
MDNLDSERISGGQSEIDNADFNIDLEAALMMLTESQKFCFVSVKLNGRTQQSVAAELGIRQPNVFKHIKKAEEKLKIFFTSRV